MIESAGDDLLKAAAGGALVLTATKRLARRLRNDFDQRRASEGRNAWPTPAIQSADAWLQEAAERLGEGWRLLGSQAIRRVWERIIEAEEAGSPQALLQLSATARTAMMAHELLSEYRKDPRQYPLSADHASFLRWQDRFVAVCSKEGWIDRAALCDLVIRAIESGDLPTPPSVWLAGFDDIPPRLRRLSEAFVLRGAAVNELLPQCEPRGTLMRIPCTDVRDEVRRAARWARALLERGETGIGIIVPDLKGYRPLIGRIFREEIDPEAQVRPGAEEVRFNLSLGEPLAAKGAVNAALAILSAGPEPTLAQAGFLLRTPYLGGSLREAGMRARLDVRLRDAKNPTVKLWSRAEEPTETERRNPREKITFSGICHHLMKGAQVRGKRLPGNWAQFFADLLREVGWPGDRPLNTFDYQVVEAWHKKVLAQMATLDLVSGPMERGEALNLLRRLATETEFQPEGPESPVQVIGLLEGAGLVFRHLWVMGLHDGAVPAPARPNPFLPIPLQVAAEMPHADAAREADFGRRVTARLFAAAPLVVLSHPGREGDASLLPSPLIRDIPQGDVSLFPGSAPTLLWRSEGIIAEEFPDSAGPPLGGAERAVGGTSILRDQALCPFRAFARHRLRARALEVPDVGLDAQGRGTLLHRTLEIFWRDVKDQSSLLAMDGRDLWGLLGECVERAVDDVYPQGEARPPEVLLALEKERLRFLVGEWLSEVEAQRTPFTVLDPEQERRESFGGLEIVARVDRIDRIGDGRRVVVDYKTGQIDAADLIADRLTEPQLPIYGLGEGENLAGVAFARLRRGEPCFAGVARDADLFPKVKPLCDWKKAVAAGIDDWDDLLKRWRDQLDALGRAFAAGEASVDPVKPEKACRICDLKSLCRIGEAQSAIEETDE
jgi:ATP-dependent helicase/nuclease subunit B